jgi:hypothetical protein
MSDVTLTDLCLAPAHRMAAASLVHAEFWTHVPGASAERMAARKALASHTDRIPLCLLALSGDDVVAVANNLSGNGTIRRSGTGSTTLSGTNTNSGEISITGGSLLFDGANALSSSAALLNATGSGSTFSLADGTTRNSTLSAGSLTMNGSNFVFDVNGAASDFLSLSGSASLTGGGKITLNLDIGNHFSLSQE